MIGEENSQPWLRRWSSKADTSHAGASNGMADTNNVMGISRKREEEKAVPQLSRRGKGNQPQSTATPPDSVCRDQRVL